MRAVETLNALGAAWAGAMTRSLVDSSVILTIALLVWLPLRRRLSSQMAYGLFLLVLVKAAFPVPVELPAPLSRLVPCSTADRLSPPDHLGSLVVGPPRRNRPTRVTRRPVPPDHAEPSGVAGLPDGVSAGNASRDGAARAVPPSPERASTDVTVTAGPPTLSTYALLMLGWGALTATLLARFAWGQARMGLRLRDACTLDTDSLSVDGVPFEAARETSIRGHTLEDYRGRHVLLDFWATWCIPCLEQEPSLKVAHDAFGNDPRFALVSLSLDEAIEAPKAYLAKHELGWTNAFLGAWSQTSVPADYGVRGIPSIWLIGPDGKVVAKDLRGDEIKTAVAQTLRQE